MFYIQGKFPDIATNILTWRKNVDLVKDCVIIEINFYFETTDIF